MSIKRAKIDRWDGGIINSDRAESVVSGASLVKNFDIYTDSKKLKPVTTFERWCTDAEREYELTAIDSLASTSADTIYATGRYIKNWLAPDFPYRISLTPNTANLTAYPDVLSLNLADLSSTFWDNITVTNGKVDIQMAIVVEGVHKTIPFKVVNIDTDNQTGWLFFDHKDAYGTDETEVVYLYWGSGTVYSTNSSYSEYMGEINAYPADAVFLFNESLEAEGQNGLYSGNADWTLDENLTTNIDFVDIDGVSTGTIGTFMHSKINSTQDLSSDNDNSNNAWNSISAGNLSVSGSFYLNSIPTANVDIFIIDETVFISITSSGKLKISTNRNGTSAQVTTSTATLSTGTLYRFRYEYAKDSHVKLWLNNSLDKTDTLSTANIYWLDGLPAFRPFVTKDIYIQNFIIDTNVDINGAYADIDYTMIYSNSDIWTLGSVETFASITPSYGGFTIYEKSIDGDAWSQVKFMTNAPLQIDDNSFTDSGLTISTKNSALVPTFIARSSNGVLGPQFALIFINDEDPTGNATLLLINNSSDVTYPNNAIQLTFSPFINTPLTSFGITPNKTDRRSGGYYFSLPNTSVYSYSGGDVSTAFSAYPTVASMDDHAGYLIIGGIRRNTAYAQIWDRSSSTANQEIDFGVGSLKVLASVKGNVVAVIDGFIDNSDKSVVKPYIEVRRWTSGSTYDTPARIEIPVNYTDGFDEAYLSPVYNNKMKLKNSVAFYAKIPTNTTATEFNEGFWAVGVNETTGQLALSLLHDTSGFGKILGYTAVGNNIYFTTSGNEAYRLSSSSYAVPSVFDTLKFEGDLINTKKKLHAVSLNTEYLDENQEITLYYKIDDTEDWVEIGTMTRSDSTNGKEKVFTKALNDYLPEFYSIQFRIKSINGSKEILELAWRYEDLTTTV